MKIKKGVTRIVFVFNSFVIKVPNIKTWKQFLLGLLANMQEKEFSTLNYNVFAKVFSPKIYGLFLIMEKVNVITDIEEIPFRQMMKIKYKDDELSEFILSDLKRSNFGYRKQTKQIIKIDYGN